MLFTNKHTYLLLLHKKNKLSTTFFKSPLDRIKDVMGYIIFTNALYILS